MSAAMKSGLKAVPGTPHRVAVSAAMKSGLKRFYIHQYLTMHLIKVAVSAAMKSGLKVPNRIRSAGSESLVLPSHLTCGSSECRDEKRTER